MNPQQALDIMKLEYGAIREDHRLAIKYITGSVSFVSTVLTLLFAYAYEKKIDMAFIVLPYIILLYYAFVYSQRYTCLVLSNYCAQLELRISAMVGHKALNWESSGLSSAFYSGWRIVDAKTGKSVFSAYAFFNFTLVSVGLLILIFSTFKGYQHLLSAFGKSYALTFLSSVLVLSVVVTFFALYTEATLPSFARNLIDNVLPVETVEQNTPESSEDRSLTEFDRKPNMARRKIRKRENGKQTDGA
ncbi:MAG: hypothetical protein Q8K00_12245 [Syntrophales bacterium]|nr:hypothetical protein [Syntrophales bacterium]